MIGKTITELEIGQSAETSRTISESDVYTFAGVTGDLNPAHLDETYAAGTAFKTRIAHGMLSAGIVSGLLGMVLPGPGTIYVGQELRFMRPVRIGDTITAKVTVHSLDVQRNRAVLLTTCHNQNGKQILDGKATVSPPKKD